MNRIEIKANGRMAALAFRRAPEAMEKHLEAKLSRGAEEVAREMKRAAPKAFSHLANSIAAQRMAPMHFRVAPAMNYGRMVEEGRRPGKMPGAGNGLLEWVKLRTRLTGKALDRATFAIARAIGRKGIKPQPYVAPTAERMAGRVHALADEGVKAGIKEAFGL